MVVNAELILIFTAASIAFIHTVIGPDHYLPFAAMSKARGWTLGKTLKITFLCGLAHVLSSVVIGVVGLIMGAQLGALVSIESVRGEWAGWALIAFGLAYMIFGLRRALANKHSHRHGDIVHYHPHDSQHLQQSAAKHTRSLTPWALFIIFILGPCEALIPLFIYPAAQQNPGLVVAVALSFGITTLLSMMAVVSVLCLGLKKVQLPKLERYSHAIAGGSLAACGTAVNFLAI